MKVAITVDVRNSHEKYVTVEYLIRDIQADVLTLTFPTWSPGSYLIREYQAQIEYFQVHTTSGKALPSTKTSKCHWQIQTGANSQIRVTYKVYANELNVRGTYADHDVVFFNPTSTLFHINDHVQIPVTLKVITPSGWMTAYVPKPKRGTYTFSNFDDLYDAPFLTASSLVTQAFKLKGVEYIISCYGKFQKDIKTITKDLQKILEKEIAVFKSAPMKRYVFQVVFAPGAYGGLEHSASSTNMFDGALLTEKKEYQRFLSLLAHEHFHLWNVKRIRPVALGPFDYTKENYTHDLWIAEGVTSFYDDHFLLRADLFTLDEYLSLISENVNKLEANKNSRVNSISDSSYDAWIRFYRQNENSINTVVSYYLKGGLVSMLLDIKILHATKGKHSLDDVMFKLMQAHTRRPEKGITRSEFFDVVQEVSGLDMKTFERDFINGVTPLPLKQHFKLIGVDMKQMSKSDQYYMGIVLGQDGFKVVASAVAEDGPAFKSKLQPKDEIIAINDERIENVKQIDKHLKNKSVKILFARRGRIFEDTIQLIKHPRLPFTLKLNPKLSTQQKRLLSAFLRKRLSKKRISL